MHVSSSHRPSGERESGWFDGQRSDLIGLVVVSRRIVASSKEALPPTPSYLSSIDEDTHGCQDDEGDDGNLSISMGVAHCSGERAVFMEMCVQGRGAESTYQDSD